MCAEKKPDYARFLILMPNFFDHILPLQLADAIIHRLEEEEATG